MQGIIEKIVFVNENNSYTVARFRPAGQKELITIIGNLASVSCGESLEISGEWENSQFGRQFKVEKYSFLIPTTCEAIEKYLGSGLIKGIGPHLAKNLVNKFKEKTLEIIENKIELLKRVNGIGENRVKIIAEAWVEQREIKNIMLFLQGHGISTNYSFRIFKTYGKETITVLKKNPYRLTQDIAGIGFKIADKIALKLGILSDSPLRIEAGILFILNEFVGEGHVYYPKADLELKVKKIIGGDSQTIETAIQNLIRQNILSIQITDKQERLYLSPFLVAEKNIAGKIKTLLFDPPDYTAKEIDKLIDKISQKEKILLDPIQKEAIQKSFLNKITVITGGPGTGKTTITNVIVKLAKFKKKRIGLASPTGRAAKQLEKATGEAAKTIHRLLDFNPGKGTFSQNSLNPLDFDIVLIDEASMIDLLLMNALIEAIPNYSHLILIGDIDQLPSVNAGTVLSDIINSAAVNCVRLKKIFRQSQESLIITNAHLINEGKLPLIKNNPGESLKDFYFIEHSQPSEILNAILHLVGERIPKRFKFNPVDDIQILTPMHKGEIGVENLNLKLQELLNPAGEIFRKGGKEFKLKDKVMQTRNNYNKEIYNGDIGRITAINTQDQTISVDFNGRELLYDKFELDDLSLAYAISVHKSQGSEYKCVIIPLSTQHYIMLQKNMLYTAISRGKELVIIVGSKEALSIAVRNDKLKQRYSNLKNFIQEKTD